MIVFSLSCDKGHVFEAWFRDGATYERQRRRRLVPCAVCGSTKVEKAPMAPRLGTGRGREEAPEAAPTPAPAPTAAVMAPGDAKAAALLQQLRALRKHVEDNADHVGDKFADEARAMHYGEKDRRSIYGDATAEEAAALADEGIDVARIPWVPRQDA